MLLIVAHHYAIHGGFNWAFSDISLSHFWYNFLFMGGRAGVNIFVLISGYYLIENESTSISFKRIFKFWAEVFFYSVVIYVIFTLCGLNEGFSIKSAVESLLPISYNSWWFASSYFVLYLIHPYLNLLLARLSKDTYQRGLFIFFFVWCLVPTILKKPFESNNLLWFVYLYAVAAYLKLYWKGKVITPKLSLIISVSFIIATYCSSVLLMLLGTKYPFFAERITRFFDMNQMPTFIWSLAVFIFFISLRPSYSKNINVIASCCFGVYLIHDTAYIRPFLWHSLFDNASHQGSWTIIPHSIICILAVYIICTLIDLFRQIAIEKPLLPVIYKAFDSFSGSANRLYHRFRGFVFGQD